MKNNIFFTHEFENKTNIKENQAAYLTKKPYFKKDNIPEIEIIDKNTMICDNKEYKISEYIKKINAIDNDFLDDVIYDYCGKCKNNRNKFFCRICNKNICDNCFIECNMNNHIPQNLEEINNESNINKIIEILNNIIIPLKQDDNIIKDITKYIDEYIIINDYNNVKSSILEDFPLKETKEENGDIFLIYQIISKDYNNYFHIRNIERIFAYLKEVYKSELKYNYEGYGKNILYNGEYYIGQFKNGLKDGKGVFFFKTERMIHVIYDEYKGSGLIQQDFNEYCIGEWKDDEINGKGMLYNKNGSYYIGDWIYTNAEGNGKFFFKNGEYYIGEWKNCLIHGKGIKYLKNGDIEYEGDWVNGKYEGNGKYIYEDGEYYIGEWKNGLIHGKGIFYYKNGNIRYEGEFINDKAEGYGKLIKKNGDYYIGQFKNALIHGKGIEYYKNGNIKYDGDFKNDECDGIGKFIYEDGTYYIGEWKNGLKNGKGKFYYKNGDYYIGKWKNNLMHGFGKIHAKQDNIIYEVFFFNGKLHFARYKNKSENFQKFKTI